MCQFEFAANFCVPISSLLTAQAHTEATAREREAAFARLRSMEAKAVPLQQKQQHLGAQVQQVKGQVAGLVGEMQEAVTQVTSVQQKQQEAKHK